MKLYTYFRSSAAYRVRIALNLKDLASEMIPIHLQKEGGINKKPEYRAINPQMRVPALKLDSGEILTQSLAIIEYLDEIHPDPPLLPREPAARAKVRAMAQLIACDIHPLNNIGPLRYLKNELGHDQADQCRGGRQAQNRAEARSSITAQSRARPLRDNELECSGRRHRWSSRDGDAR